MTTKHNNKVYALITRPEKKAQALASSLAALDIACLKQPLFDYQALADSQTSERLLNNVDILIFVSTAAVEFAHAKYNAKNWRYQLIIAVGKATKKALNSLGIDDVLCPTQENSEGVLALPELTCLIQSEQKLNQQAITIVRGNDGREHLATELSAQGANVNYLESYQLVWRSFTKDIGKQWFNQQINCIVVTSNAILEKLIQLTIEQAEKANDVALTTYWRDHCIWLVTSPRISNNAKTMGLKHVMLSDGANELNVTEVLRQLVDKPVC